MPHRTKVKYCSWGNVSYDVKLDIVLDCYSHNEHLWFKLLNHLAHPSNSHCSANTCPAQCPQSPSVSETKLQLHLPSSMKTTTQSPPSPTRQSHLPPSQPPCYAMQPQDLAMPKLQVRAHPLWLAWALCRVSNCDAPSAARLHLSTCKRLEQLASSQATAQPSQNYPLVQRLLFYLQQRLSLCCFGPLLWLCFMPLNPTLT